MSDMADAIRFFYSGNLEAAESILETIVKEEQLNVNALTRYGAVLEGLGKTREAGDVYKRLAWVYYREQSYAECLGVLEKAMQYLPEDDTLLSLKGKCLYYLARYREALPHFTMAPPDVETSLYTGKTYFALKQYSEALQEFQSIRKKGISKENKQQADYWIGKSFLALGEYAKAIPYLVNYKEEHNGETQIYLDLAICNLESGKLDQAENLLMEYQEMGGNADLAKLYLGMVSYHRGNMEKALEFFNDTEANEMVLRWKGFTYYGMGLYEEAIDCLSILLKTSDELYLLKTIGNAHLKLGNYYEAKMLFEKAIDENGPEQELEKLLAIAIHYLGMDDS